MKTTPLNPLMAATLADPYPYYADLIANRPLYRDEEAGLWIATSAQAVTAVLNSEICRVRPSWEPIPKALLSSPAAEIFRRLIRMNDGERHHPMKQAVTSTLNRGSETVMQESRKWARLLIAEIEPTRDHRALTDFAFRLPTYVVASLLGVPQEELKQTARWMSQFVYCMAANGSPEQIEQGKLAAYHLLKLFHRLLETQPTPQAAGLLHALVHQAGLVGCTDLEVVTANGIGFLWQGYEATAGLIGNTLLALARQAEIYKQVVAQPELLQLVIQEVLRYDPPIQNTRRFLSQDGRIEGEQMKAGEAILVVVAAANRDPQANREPERFDIFRQDRRAFTFGSGAHACPGSNFAAQIAQAGVEQLISAGLDVQALATTVSYRASVNARVPLFTGEK